MATKNIALDWTEFMRGNVIAKEPTLVIFRSAATAHVALAAATASAATWSKILVTILTMADYTCIGVIIYAGATWMFGNRTKAIELLLGGSIGYIIVRHAQDIQSWLSGL